MFSSSRSGTKRPGTRPYGARPGGGGSRPGSGSRMGGPRQGDSRAGGMGGGRGGRGDRVFRKKSCRFCAERTSYIDYKDVEKISKFLTEKGKVIPRRISGNCAKHQRVLARAVKLCRHSGLVPFQVE